VVYILNYLYDRGQFGYGRHFYCVFIYYTLQVEYAAQCSVASRGFSAPNIHVLGDASSQMIRRFVQNCAIKNLCIFHH